MYKKQEFGARNTFTTPIYLTGEDEFGTRDWGLTPDDVPAGDRKAWSDSAAAYPDFVPPRDIRDHVLILDAVDKKPVSFFFLPVLFLFLFSSLLNARVLVLDSLDPKSSCGFFFSPSIFTMLAYPDARVLDLDSLYTKPKPDVQAKCAFKRGFVSCFV
jgi:hypothetical protein